MDVKTALRGQSRHLPLLLVLVVSIGALIVSVVLGN